MASLSSILSSKLDSTGKSGSATGAIQTNIEKGTVWFFNPGADQGTDAAQQTFTWTAPTTGCVVLEVWGASGSSAAGRCCSNGISGNPGAYSRKIFPVNGSSTICGTVGRSCGTPTYDCRGCSEASQICWVGSAGNGCMCAMGGRGGYHFPSSQCNTSPYCCFVAAGFCHTNYGTCCGLICHYCDNGGGEPEWIANAWGGDVNKSGGFSCVTLACDRPIYNCSQTHHIAVSPGLFGEDGAVVNVVMELDTGYSNGNGNGIHQLIGGLNALSRHPQGGIPFSACWSGMRACGCYQNTGCVNYLPHGVPGIAAMACATHCSNGYRGGNGAVRIKFIGS